MEQFDSTADRPSEGLYGVRRRLATRQLIHFLHRLLEGEGPSGGHFGLELALRHSFVQQEIKRCMLPAPKQALEALPRKLLGKDAECVICTEDLPCGTKIVEMPCLHVFHDGCLMRWLNNHNSCPVCRFELKSPAEDFSELLPRRSLRRAVEEESESHGGHVLEAKMDDEESLDEESFESLEMSDDHFSRLRQRQRRRRRHRLHSGNSSSVAPLLSPPTSSGESELINRREARYATSMELLRQIRRRSAARLALSLARGRTFLRVLSRTRNALSGTASTEQRPSQMLSSVATTAREAAELAQRSVVAANESFRLRRLALAARSDAAAVVASTANSRLRGIVF